MLWNLCWWLPDLKATPPIGGASDQHRKAAIKCLRSAYRRHREDGALGQVLTLDR
jgi:hypothetical protein